MSSVTYKTLQKELASFLPKEQIITDDLLTYAFGVDASFYSLTPKIVIVVENEDQVVHVIALCNRLNIPFTFRAAGTSLSGQAVSDSVLIKLGSRYSKIVIEENGSIVKCHPGASGGEVNRQLLAYNRKLGPDPASANVAKIGGILANNASGMTSGVIHNSYNTLLGMRIVFNDGTILDTNDTHSISQFSISHKNLIKQILLLSQQIRNNKSLFKKIESKYKIKNTCGYGLNSFTDFSDPVKIIAHLMIGSEGTLGFISEVTLKTVDNFPFKATTFLLFKDLAEACRSIPILKEAQVDCAELMDYAALQSIKDMPGIPFNGHTLSPGAAAVLVEISAEDEALLKSKQVNLVDKLNDLSLVNKASFTIDPLERAQIWKIRKGLFPTGCKTRETGTTVIIEDLNFPVALLDSAVSDVQDLLKKYEYNNSFIWGHALAGNIHFVLTQKFDSKDKISSYDSFMHELVKLVIDKYNGSLKAEHGTGRNMAPFVAYEWGDEAYSIMQQVKQAFDPEKIVNPGVLLNDDPQIHIKNIKSVNRVHDKVDKCTECGFCEKICPSKNFTVTPRQRITLFRKVLANRPLNAKTLKKISKKFKFNVDETCAVDGMCQTECPVDINVGDFIKDIRNVQHTAISDLIANLFATNFKTVTQVMRFVIILISIKRKILGDKIFFSINRILSAVSFGKIPEWHSSFPNAAQKRNIINSGSDVKEVLYFQSCINRVFGKYSNSSTHKTLSDTIRSVVKKADFGLRTIDITESLCCGMAFASKGYYKQSRYLSEKLYTTIKQNLKTNDSPVLFDTSPCAMHFKEYLSMNHKNDINVCDPAEFASIHLAERVSFNKIPETILLHPVCSLKRNNYSDKLSDIAHRCAKKVILTEPLGCCGFAGDKGIRTPGLNKSALAELPYDQYEGCREGYSTSRMCEIGMTRESNIPFNSIFYLLDKSIISSRKL